MVDFFCFIRNYSARIYDRRRSLSSFRLVSSLCFDYLSYKKSFFSCFQDYCETLVGWWVTGPSILDIEIVCCFTYLCVSTVCSIKEVFFSSYFFISSTSFCRSACTFLQRISSWLACSMRSYSFISCSGRSVVLRVLLALSSQ
jgi:hypothetical protein